MTAAPAKSSTVDNSTPAARRSARYRRRQQRCRVIVAAEVGPEVVEALCRAGWLPDDLSADRAAIGEATTAMLRAWAEAWR